jgi:hypothetical protein
LGNEQSLAVIINAFDECIEKYIEDRRKRIDGFTDKHFSIQETLTLQKRYILADLFLNPLNSLWAIPYLSIKKVVETLDKLGWTRFTALLDRLPSSIKTRYQKEIEQLIAKELLGLEGLEPQHFSKNILIEDLKKHPVLGKLIASETMDLGELPIDLEFKKQLEKYSSSQAMISDLAGSLMTLFAGWLFFGDKSLGIFGLGNRIARKMARDRASSKFFLGDGLGSVFYRAFPPTPSGSQVFIATLIVGVLLTTLSLFASVMSDPLRKRLGLHKRKLNSMLDELEEGLFLQVKKAIKISYKTSKNQVG